MNTLDMKSTKWKLFEVSIDAFAKYGYGSVSIRDIAGKVGIRDSSLYKHFESKDTILFKIYEFYEVNFFESLPDVNELLALVGKVNYLDILKQCIVFYAEDLAPFMRNALIIASEECIRDERAKNLLLNTFYKSYYTYYYPILTKMIEMNIIEPIDVDKYIDIISSYDYAASFRGLADFAISKESYIYERELLFKLLAKK